MENKTSSYIKYALGEIILVVIGILIALQINTWNTQRIDRAKEQEYLLNLVEDIKAQQILVNDQINHEKKMRLQVEKALVHLNSESINADTVNKYITNITRKSFVVNDPTFQDLKSSGNILLIRNNALRKKILSFYQYLDYSALVIQTSNETGISEFRDFLMKYPVVNINFKDTFKVAGNIDWSVKTVSIPWAKKLQEDKLNNKEFLFVVLNHVAQRGRNSSVHIDIMQRMEKRIIAMQNDIEQNLDND
ncbi:DUF6090 family protein [Muriicola soli]|uniref:Uncharacterized protein n=1 Tax=Muriicola soli TaxID=2507538 RepID=A0A411EAR5_9FLAO|nr:DUF6090 family protein [Muriicola soli]QBA64614.1 hypothetical protein EQY75_08790 [Muriicola soli]